MRIGYYITHFPYEGSMEAYIEQYSCGGAEIAAYQLAVGIGRNGNEVRVFTSSFDGRDSIERQGSITVHRYATNFSIESGNISLGMFRKPQRYQVDIVHAHLGQPPAPLAALWHAQVYRLPLIVTYHSDMQASYGTLPRRIALFLYNTFLLDRILSRARVIISPSQHFIGQSRFLRKYRNKVVTIPNAINLRDFSVSYSKAQCRGRLGLSAQSNIILFVGVLAPHKGPDVLLRAMPEIIKKVPDTICIFVGTGALRRKLKELSKELGVENRVQFAGFIGDTFTKALYYKSSDVLVLPSTMTTETFGIVNLEAMACGIPVVASRVGGVPEVVKDEESGLLVPPKDPPALANAVVRLLQDQQLRHKLSKQAKSRVKDYSWERVIQETEKIYVDALTLET